MQFYRLTCSGNSYSTLEYFLRLSWFFTYYFFFRFTPRPFYFFRNFLLLIFGSKIGRNVKIYPSAKITCPWLFEIGDNSAIGDSANIYNLGLVTIGSNTTISQHSYLCGGTHDYSNPAMPLIRSSITVGNYCWVAARAFVGPNSFLNDYSIIGANSSFFGNAEKFGIYVGSPAVYLKSRLK